MAPVGLVAQLVRSVVQEHREAEQLLIIADLGVVDYDAALEMQEDLRERRIRGEVPDLLLLLEHPAVYTLGRRAEPAHLRSAAGSAVPVRRVGRGGGITFHGPGQLVGYPIIDLARRGADVREYVRRLEDVLLRTVVRFGIAGQRRGTQAGVWVAGRKVASIGIGIRRWVTSHGFGLNISTDLTFFDAIVPCGLPDVRMTSLVAEGVRPDPGQVGRLVVEGFVATFDYQAVRWLGEEVRARGDRGPTLRCEQ